MSVVSGRSFHATDDRRVRFRLEREARSWIERTATLPPLGVDAAPPFRVRA